MIAKKPKMLLSIFLSIILIITTVVGCTFTEEENSNKPEKLAETFLRNIYEVESHDRYENYLKAFDEYSKQMLDSSKSNVVSIGEEVFQEYIDLYTPLMTGNALENLFANGYAYELDSLAYDNNFTSEVKVINLSETEGSGEAIIYDYRVDLDIISIEKKESLEVEGIIQLEKNEDGKYKVSYFTINKRPLYEMFK